MKRLTSTLIALILFAFSLEACQPIQAESQAGRVPLKAAAVGMEPRGVWQNFEALTQIPRSSGHVEQVRAYLVKFGQQLKLETIVDQAGNVLIRKPAGPGLQNREGVILQGHMDMVLQKTPGSPQDFLTDQISAYQTNKRVRLRLSH